MTNKLEISRETLENSLKDGSSDPVVYASYRKAVADIRAALAAPIVALQDDALSKGFHTTQSGGGEYTINIGFRSLADMQSADKQLRDLLRSRISPPAPVAVVLPTTKELRELVTKSAREADLIPGANYYTAAELAAGALFDKLKELNP